MTRILFVASLLLVSSLLLACPAVGDDEVYSGPQPGEKLASFSMRGVLGDLAGKEIDLMEKADGKPVVLVFMHKLTRPSAAVTRAVLCRFPRNRMEALLLRFPRLQSRLLSVASHELAVAQEQMLVLGRKTAKEKLATFLLSLSRRAADRGQQADPVILSMSRTDIGDYVGLTTETVSRTFTQLRGQGLIALHAGGRVELRQRETLEALAQGG